MKSLHEFKLNEDKKYKIVDINTMKKVIKILGNRPSDDKIIDFIKTNYNLDDEYEQNKVADIVGYYKLDTEEYFDKDGNFLDESVDSNEAFELNEAKNNLYLQLHKKYANQIEDLKAKKIKKLTDLVSIQRWSLEARKDYFDMDAKVKKEITAQFKEERKLLKKYMDGDYSVMLPKGTESIPK
tara:strand:+ start:1088 stop:1636 length:549 start_codon:yes stop_codon:yes gene_type:complete